jgi:hypothetical protein
MIARLGPLAQTVLIQQSLRFHNVFVSADRDWLGRSRIAFRRRVRLFRSLLQVRREYAQKWDQKN